MYLIWGRAQNSFGLYRYPIQHHLLKRLFISTLNNFDTFGENWSTIYCGSPSRIPILFHWSVCLSLCQYHTILITVALKQVLKSGSVNLPTLLFFYKIIQFLAILVLFHFHINFSISLTISTKKSLLEFSCLLF